MSGPQTESYIAFPSGDGGLLPSCLSYTTGGSAGGVSMTSRVGLSEVQQFQNTHADVHKKPFRSFDLRRLFNFSSYGKSKRSKETNGSDVYRRYLDSDVTQERLIQVDFSSLVQLPAYVDYNEWLASHTQSFVENINIVYGCLSDYCLPSVCATMNGPGNVKYQWIDDKNRKCKCSAPQYIDYVMSYSHSCIYNETIFPTKYGNVFPNSFEATVRKIHRLLLHVVAHIYQVHTVHIEALKLMDCLNTVSYHFMLFSKHFQLIDEREMDILDDLYLRLQGNNSDDTHTTKSENSSLSWLSDKMRSNSSCQLSKSCSLCAAGLNTVHQCSEVNKENMSRERNCMTSIPLIASI